MVAIPIDVELTDSGKSLRSMHGINPVPENQTKGSAGFDLRACIEERVLIPSGERYLVPNGFRMELHENYFGLVCPRSGLAVEQGLSMPNAPGVIDPDYRGEMHTPLINFGEKIFYVQPGMRIAQLLILNLEKVSFHMVSSIDADTERGEGGFGSTGTG